MTLLSVQHASLGYHSRHPVLRDVSFSVAPGSICCLIGANGSGKTTLMRTILGVLQPLAGQITLDGIAVNHLSDRERAAAIAWVPQAHDGAFAFTALDMVMMGLAPQMAAFAVPGGKERDIALLMSTHHPLHARAIADSVVRVEPDGLVSQGGPEHQLAAERLATLYRVTPSQIAHHLFGSHD